MEDKEQIELEVRRLLAEEIETHRNFLQSQFKNMTWGLGILFAVGAAIFVYLFGKSVDDSTQKLVSTVDSKVIE